MLLVEVLYTRRLKKSLTTKDSIFNHNTLTRYKVFCFRKTLTHSEILQVYNTLFGYICVYGTMYRFVGFSIRHTRAIRTPTRHG